MASTATNKQPLLIDRPLHEGSIVNGASASTSTDLGAAGISGTLLVNCTQNDGALIEDIYAISRGEDYTINLYLSNFADLLRPFNIDANIKTRYIGKIAGSATDGTVTRFEEAPYVLAPTANVGTEPQLRALYVPKGQALWATRQTADLTVTTDGPIVGAQGGYY